MPRTVSWIVALAALLWRLYPFSGDGLGDDANYFASYYRIYHDHQLIDWHYDYRIFFRLPVISLWRVCRHGDSIQLDSAEGV